MHFIKLTTAACLAAVLGTSAQEKRQIQTYEQIANTTVSTIVNDFRVNGDVAVLRGLIDIAFAALQSEAALVASCLRPSSSSSGLNSIPATPAPASSSGSILNPSMPNPPPLNLPLPIPTGPGPVIAPPPPPAPQGSAAQPPVPPQAPPAAPAPPALVLSSGNAQTPSAGSGQQSSSPSLPSVGNGQSPSLASLSSAGLSPSPPSSSLASNGSQPSGGALPSQGSSGISPPGRPNPALSIPSLDTTMITSLIPLSRQSINGSTPLGLPVTNANNPNVLSSAVSLLSSNIGGLSNPIRSLAPVNSAGGNPVASSLAPPPSASNNVAGNLISNVNSAVTGLVNTLAAPLPSPIGAALSGVNSLAGGVLSGVGGLANGVVSDVTALPGGVLSGAGAALTGVIGGVASVLPTPIGRIVSGAGNLVGAVASNAGAAIGGVESIAGGLVNGLLGAGQLPPTITGSPVSVSGIIVSGTGGAVATCTNLICLQASLPGLLGLNADVLPTGGSGGPLLNVGVGLLGGGNAPAAAPAVTTPLASLISAAGQVSSAAGRCTDLVCLQASLPGVISLSAGLIPTSGANLGNLLGIGLNLFNGGRAQTLATVQAGTGSAVVAAVTTSAPIMTSVPGQAAPVAQLAPVTSWMFLGPLGL